MNPATLRRYRNPKAIHEKVFVLTDKINMRIEILLMRGPQYQDEHVMNFHTADEYHSVEYDIFTTLRDKGFVFYAE